MITPARSNYCTFYLDQYYFGIEVHKVQEIIRCQHVTPVALAPRVVTGLINLRGQIFTAIDLRRLLELPERDAADAPMNIVVKTAQGAFSLLADRVGDVLELSDEQFEDPPANLGGMAEKLIQRAYMLDDALLLTMAVSRVVSADVLNGLPDVA